MSSTTPETAFSQNDAHMVGRNRRSSAIGIEPATPSIRSAITALMPATNPRPIV
jgi:hypothetical protein